MLYTSPPLGAALRYGRPAREVPRVPLQKLNRVGNPMPQYIPVYTPCYFNLYDGWENPVSKYGLRTPLCRAHNNDVLVTRVRCLAGVIADNELLT